MRHVTGRLPSANTWDKNPKLARRASISFLNRVLGPGNYLRRRLQSWWHFYSYGRLLLDRSVALAGPRHTFRCACPIRENLLQAIHDDRAILMLTAHFGAAELTAPMLQGQPDPRPFHFVVYRDMRDTTEHFHRDQWKSLADIDWINSTDPIVAGIRVMKALKNADVVAIRADRPMQGRAIVAEFCGRPMQLPAGPFMAAVLSGASVINAFTVRTGYRTYQMHASMPRKYEPASGLARAQLLNQAVQDYVADLERIVRQYPYQWGNFYDVWLTSSAGGGSETVEN